MSQMTVQCPKCGLPLPSDAPQGLCPKCLLQQATFMTDAGENRSPARPEPPSLEVLARHFPQLEILEMIGRGGMGFVFKAKQPKLDRLVALKILAENVSAESSFAERFTREGRALARLSHPNIVAVHDFGQAGPFFYLLMEFVDGVNLRQSMQARQVSPAEALAIVPRICDALQYAHGEGILHRDIKPDNILLDRKGRVKIADFGIAKLLNEPAAQAALTASGAALGTVHYMAPEQIERPNTVDHRADIYSLGVVFYEMLTGELPIGRFPAPSETGPMDPRLDKVVFKTLAKEPARRPQSAEELGTEVQHIASGGPDPKPETKPEAATPIRVQRCYISTPEHLQTWLGRQWIYTGSGQIRLEPDQLIWRNRRNSIVIPLRSITRLSLGEFPRLSKPFGLKNIAVTWLEGSTERRILFIPHRGALRSTWTTSETVEEWFTALQVAAKALTGQIPPASPRPSEESGEGSAWPLALLRKVPKFLLIFFIFYLASFTAFIAIKRLVGRRPAQYPAEPTPVVASEGFKTIHLVDLQGTADAVSATSRSGLAPGETVRAVISYSNGPWAPSDETETRYRTESDGTNQTFKTTFTWSLPTGFATAFDVRAEVQRVTASLLAQPLTLPPGGVFPVFSIENKEGKRLSGGLEYRHDPQAAPAQPLAEGKIVRVIRTSSGGGAVFAGQIPSGFCLAPYTVIDGRRQRGIASWHESRKEVNLEWPKAHALEFSRPGYSVTATNYFFDGQSCVLAPGQAVPIFQISAPLPGEAPQQIQAMVELIPIPNGGDQ